MGRQVLIQADIDVPPSSIALSSAAVAALEWEDIPFYARVIVTVSSSADTDPGILEKPEQSAIVAVLADPGHVDTTKAACLLDYGTSTFLLGQEACSSDTLSCSIEPISQEIGFGDKLLLSPTSSDFGYRCLVSIQTVDCLQDTLSSIHCSKRASRRCTDQWKLCPPS